MSSDVLTFSQQTAASPEAGEVSLKEEMARIARLAARLFGAASTAVFVGRSGETSLEGSFGPAEATAELLEILPRLTRDHDAEQGPLLFTAAPLADLRAGWTPDGGPFRTLASIPIRLPDGELYGCIAIADTEPREWGAGDLEDAAGLAQLAATLAANAEEIEEAVWLEEAIQVQAAYLDHLFEAAPEAIALLDEKGRIIRVNAQHQRMFGYAPEEVIGRSPRELIIPPQGVEEAGELGQRARKGERLRAEVVRQRKDGSDIPVLLLGIPVRISREHAGIYVIYRDLTPDRDAQQAIQRNEERFRSLIEKAMDLVAVITPGGTIDYVTPSVERLLGPTPAALIGTSAFGLLHPDDAANVIERFRAVVRNECEGSLEFRLRSRLEGWRTFEVRARSMVTDPGAEGIVINARDVTDERSAMEGHRQLNAFLDATPDFIAVFDAHGRVLRLNHAFRALLEIADDAPVETMTLTDLFPREVTEQLRHEGIPTAGREGVWSGETQLQSPSGTEVPISQVILAHRTPSGALEFISTLARDITAQKSAETALRRSEAHFRSLIENALDIISITDVEGNILFTSPSVRRVLGFAPEQLVGGNIFAYIHPDEVQAARESFGRVLHERDNEPAEYRIRHQDGSWRRVESVSENLLANPAVGGVVINSRDVTERRRAEEALNESQQQLLQSQKMEAVGRLAGGIAHDFNNLLTAIKGFTELLLLDFDENDPRRSFAGEIQGAASRAAGLTRQLLAFSRRQVLQPEVLDINATVVEMEKLLERMVGEDLLIRCSLDPALGRVKADPGQLEQVLMNLVVNARDAMPQGGEVSIRTMNAELTSSDVQLYHYVKPGNFVLLEVSDTGSGMSQDVLDRIFEPFYTTKEQGKGTGLGLSTVYGIVKQSGGYIWVESEVDEGTTFRVYLPRVDEEVVGRAPARAEATSLDGSETILLVEDELAVRVLVRRVLERMGYRVVEASNGGEALARLRERNLKPDLLLTDVVMPGMSGRELANQLTQLQPAVRVLYMSGYTDEAIVHHGVLNPGVAFIEKPFTPDLLLRKLREVLDGPAPSVG